MLEAVRWAPSAANTQPWELVLIDDETIQRQLRDAYLEESLLHDAHYQIPEGLRIVSFVTMGITANETRFTENLRIPIHEKTFHNHYGTMALDRQRKEHS